MKRATLYRHAKEEKLTASTNGQNKMVVDFAELERLYSKLKMPPEEQHETDETTEIRQSDTDADSQNVIDILKGHLADTKAELQDAKARETELLSLLKVEQEKTRLLMLTDSHKSPEKFSFWNYFRWNILELF